MSKLVAEISAILEQHAGLDATVLGKPLIEQAIQTRFKQLQLGDPARYACLLEQEDELRQLLELTLIGETWFFRDRKPFFFLASQAAQIRRPLNILCAPCATGEEAYSIAIVLSAAGLTDFHVDAMDISRNSLRKAIAAEYKAHSFREDLPEFNNYFYMENGMQKVCEKIRSHVTFRPINLANDNELSLLGTYDFIFCRNLLIYFLPDLRTQLLSSLRRCLRPDGLLFTGHSELLAASSDDFEICPQTGCFALRRIDHQTQEGTNVRRT